MAWVASVLGVIVSGGFLLAAAVMNWRYGLGLGRSDSDQMLFALIAAGVDVMKVLLPFFLVWSFKNGRWLVSILCSIWLVATMSYSIAGVAGYLDLNRSLVASKAEVHRAEVGDTAEQLEHRRQQLARIGVAEPVAVARQKLEAIRQDPRWRTTRDCATPRTEDARAFCGEARAAQVEYAKSGEAARLRAEIDAIRSRSMGHHRTAVARDGDHRSAAVSHVTGWGREVIEIGLVVLLLVIVEGISTFGIFLSINHGELRQLQAASLPATASLTEAFDPEQLANDAMQFMTECLRPAEGQAIGFGTMYMMYVGWCAQLGRGAVDQPTFETAIAELCERFGFAVHALPDGRCCADMAVR